MTSGADKMAYAKARIESQPEAARQIGATYKFMLAGEGGGTWVMNLQEDVKVEEGDGEAQCTIKMQGSDFVDLLEGRASAQQLFFSGRLRIEGDMGLAMRLQKLTELLR